MRMNSFFLVGAITFATVLLADAAGKVVLVTGASSGIGLTSSKYFAQQGLRVVLTARRLGKLEEAVKEIKAAGGDAAALSWMLPKRRITKPHSISLRRCMAM